MSISLRFEPNYINNRALLVQFIDDKALDHDNVAESITKLLTNDYNEKGNFKHDKTHTETYLYFKMGEILPTARQADIQGILQALHDMDNHVKEIIIETNADQELDEEFAKFMYNYTMSNSYNGMMPKGRGTGQLSWHFIDDRAGNRPINEDNLIEYLRAANQAWLTSFINKNDFYYIDTLYKKLEEEGIEMMFAIAINTDDKTLEETLYQEAIDKGYNLHE